MYDARQIANWFVQKFKDEGQLLTIMKLLKLVYLAHGWYLGATGKSLIKNRVEAWQYGPVIPDVYYAFRNQGVVLNGECKFFDANIDDEYARVILGFVCDNYGAMSAEELSDLTHEKNAPWDIAISARGRFTPIANGSIFAYYNHKMKQGYKTANVE